MNERSSLAFPAHLLVKQPPGQPHTPTATPPWRVQFPLPCPSLCWVSLPLSLPPSLQSGHLLLQHREGGGKPVTLLLPRCSTELHSARWPPAGKPTEENLGLHLCI